MFKVKGVKVGFEEVDKPMRAIICFGYPTEQTGMKAGEFYTAVIDPHMQSPSGEFLRFDQTIQGLEVHGWQRIDGFTVCEFLGEHTYNWPNGIPEGYDPKHGEKVTVRVVTEWDAL